MRRRARLLYAGALLALLSGCGDPPFSPRSSGDPPASIRIDLPVFVSLLIEGDSIRPGLTVMDAAGRPIPYLPPWAVPLWTAAGDGALQVSDDGLVLAAQPGDGVVQVEVAGLTASAAVRVDPEVITMDVPGAYMVQTVQRLDANVPILAGRDAVLRVFVQGNARDNSYTPPVRVDLYMDGEVVETIMIPAGAPAVPHVLDEGRLSRSWNVRVPAALVRPGLAFRVELDPGETVPRRPESRTRFPHDGDVQAVDVRVLAPHRVRFVPVRYSASGVTGDVHDENADTYLALFERLFPVPAVEADVRAPYTTDALAAETEGWLTILSEMSVLRQVDGASHYYYGVVRRAGGTWGGFAYIGQPTAIGYDRMDLHPNGTAWAATLFAHEVGHNFGRRHAPCGNPSGVDAAYPYPGATIGVYGYDLARDVVRGNEMRDIMSYCYEWISDYTYMASWSFRQNQAAGGAEDAIRDGREPVLLVWGRVGPDGDLVLEPAFQLEARPALPTGPGPYTVAGLDAAGRVLFSISFAGDEIGHEELGTRLFTFAIPVAGIDADRLDRLRLSGPTGATEVRGRPGRDVDADTAGAALRPSLAGGLRLDWRVQEHPMAMVRDADTGVILALARAGQVDLPPGTGPVEVLLSHGTGSSPARLRWP